MFMSSLRVRPRSSIADAELARAATVELPVSHVPRPHTPQGLAASLNGLRHRGTTEPDRVIIMTLATVAVRRR